MCPLTYRRFRISFKDDVIEVGKESITEGENITMLTWKIPTCQKKEQEVDCPVRFTHFAFTTGCNRCSWKFDYYGNYLANHAIFYIILCNLIHTAEEESEKETEEELTNNGVKKRD